MLQYIQGKYYENFKGGIIMNEYINSLQRYARRFEAELKQRGFFAKYKVETIWIDYGANWKDNTIVVYYNNRNNDLDSFQILSPRDIKEIKSDCFADKDFYRLLNKHIEMFGKYNWG